MNSDNSVKKLKSGSFRPIINQFERSSILSSFEFIDKIVIFEENTPLNLIKNQPKFIFKGDDYKTSQVVGNKEINKMGRFSYLILYQNKSTSKIIERIKNGT